jgi:hypothetical protein
MNTFLKALGTIALLLLGLTGLLMSLCGGVFTINFLGTSEMRPFLAIAVPSLAIGAGLLWFAVRKLRRRFSGRSGNL